MQELTNREVHWENLKKASIFDYESAGKTVGWQEGEMNVWTAANYYCMSKKCVGKVQKGTPKPWFGFSKKNIVIVCRFLLGKPAIMVV